MVWIGSQPTQQCLIVLYDVGWSGQVWYHGWEVSRMLFWGFTFTKARQIQEKILYVESR